MKLFDRWKQPIKEPYPSMVYADLKNLNICIHQIHGCGQGWHLSCKTFRFDDYGLDTDDFNSALEIVQEHIKAEFILLQNDIVEFANFRLKGSVSE